MLDELKPVTAGLSDEGISRIFFEALSSIYNGDNTEMVGGNSTSVNVDIYA
jgi:hypothetical protein